MLGVTSHAGGSTWDAQELLRLLIGCKKVTAKVKAFKPARHMALAHYYPLRCQAPGGGAVGTGALHGGNQVTALYGECTGSGAAQACCLACCPGRHDICAGVCTVVAFSTGKAIVFFSLVLEERAVCSSSGRFNNSKLSAARRIGLPDFFPL